MLYKKTNVLNPFTLNTQFTDKLISNFGKSNNYLEQTNLTRHQIPAKLTLDFYELLEFQIVIISTILQLFFLLYSTNYVIITVCTCM